jgi:Zn-finger nucleic acid-binding protein
MTSKKFTRRPAFLSEFDQLREFKSAMNCPECGFRMLHRRVQGVTIDRCDGCGGLWFDMEEVRRYVREWYPDAEYVPDDDHFHFHTKGAGTSCTCCGKQNLEIGSLKGVSFERCTWCGGIFVNEKDLARMVGPKPSEGLHGAEATFGILEVLFGLAELVSSFD